VTWEFSFFLLAGPGSHSGSLPEIKAPGETLLVLDF